MGSTSPRRGAGRTTAVFLVGIGLGALYTVLITRWRRDPDLALMQRVVELTEEEFIDEVDRGHLIDEAARGLLDGLDDYSAYYSSAEIARLDRETYGEFRGIGVVFRSPVSAGQILFPFPGSPAEEGGLRVGDRLVAIDGLAFAELEAPALQRRITATDGAPLQLTVEGLDGAQREATVVPRRILDPTVRHEELVDEDAGTGYLAVLAFNHRTPEEFDDALGRLREAGCSRLVIDLRANAGGILESAIELANRFVAEGTIVSTATRTGVRTISADPKLANLVGLPLVLLVDGSTASASEVLAGALQDHAAAVLVGEPTYGKGTVQTLTRVGSGRAVIKLTTAHYYTPGWRGIERGRNELSQAGLAPEVLVPISRSERLALHDWLSTYTPPAEELTAIEAWAADEDEPILPRRPQDAQLEVALGLLRGERPHADGAGELLGAKADERDDGPRAH